GFADFTLVGLDVTQMAIADAQWLTRVASLGTPWAQFATRILDYYADFHKTVLGRRICILHDPLAAAIMLDSELAGYREFALGVELRGENTRGQLLADARGITGSTPVASAFIQGRHTVKVAQRADVGDFLERMFMTLNHRS